MIACPVYLDPPFNSNRDDNVIFGDESGNATDAQLRRHGDLRLIPNAWAISRTAP